MPRLTVTCSIFPAGPVSFAIGGEYDAPRFTRDRDALNNTFQSALARWTGKASSVNRDIWGGLRRKCECHLPVRHGTSRASTASRVDFAEREEWYSTNTSAVLPSGLFPAVPAQHSQV